jgi:hypothetical protein
VQFAPWSPHIFSTCGKDGKVHIWDKRVNYFNNMNTTNTQGFVDHTSAYARCYYKSQCGGSEGIGHYQKISSPNGNGNWLGSDHINFGFPSMVANRVHAYSSLSVGSIFASMSFQDVMKEKERKSKEKAQEAAAALAAEVAGQSPTTDANSGGLTAGNLAQLPGNSPQSNHTRNGSGVF